MDQILRVFSPLALNFLPCHPERHVACSASSLPGRVMTLSKEVTANFPGFSFQKRKPRLTNPNAWRVWQIQGWEEGIGWVCGELEGLWFGERRRLVHGLGLSDVSQRGQTSNFVEGNLEIQHFRTKNFWPQPT